MKVSQTSNMDYVLAKLLMLETVQTSICTFLANHPAQTDHFFETVFHDAENELRLRAIAEIGASTRGRTGELALVYLTENAKSIRATTSEAPDPPPRQLR